jgi:hypothetical protein
MLLFCALTVLLGMVVHAADAPAPGRVTAYTLWSRSSLFVGLRVDDAMVVGNQTEPLSQPWLDDAVAIYLDLDPTDGDALNEKCVRVIISAAGGATVQRARNGIWQDDPIWFQYNPLGVIRYGVQVNGKINDNKAIDKGYHVEVGLNWQLLGVAPPEQRVHGPLPAIGLAIACYSQGEMQAVSCCRNR